MNSASINAAAPGSTLWDDKVPGLHVRCFPNRKSFYLYYRTKEGRERRPKLGDAGALSLSAAREAARLWLADVARGIDPQANWRASRAAPTLSAAIEKFELEYAPNLKSGREVMRVLRKLVEPRLRGVKVEDIELGDAQRLHAALSGSPCQANRALAHLSRLLSLCEVWGWRKMHSNPCHLVKRNPERSRARFTTPEEYERLGAVLKAKAVDHPASVAFILLIMFSGARPMEISNAKWEDLTVLPDRSGKLRLPDGKTGGRTVHLPAQAVDVLQRLPRTNGTLTGVKYPAKLWRAVRREAGCPDLWLRDQRRSFATVALANGVASGIIGELLGQKSAQTTKIYARLMDSAAKDAAGITAGRIENMIGWGYSTSAQSSDRRSV